ncbi:unnamed protein product [Schistosoma curassoni]|nr:unnamed protein product [Schistosoma curassoni]
MPSMLFVWTSRRWIKEMTFIHHYMMHKTKSGEASIRSPNIGIAAANVTGDFMIQFATIIMVCLSLSRDRVKKVPVRADFFLQHIVQRNTMSSRQSAHRAAVI